MSDVAASSFPMVLSVQSHVAYGHVGNSAALFTLQRLGIEAVAVNTVQFSNHTGYGEFRGQVFAASHIRDVFEGLRARGVLAQCNAVLSGYLGDAETGEAIIDVVDEIRRSQPSALYLCDPVMGDVGRGMFVRPGIPDFVKRKAVPSADMITPNQYEFEYLVGRSLKDTADAIAAARELLQHERQLEHIVITSLITADVADDRLRTLAVSRTQAGYVEAPRIALDPLPNGMGDTFSAVLLGSYLRHRDMARALEHATGTLTGLLQHTRRGMRDLPLIAAQQRIVAPGGGYSFKRVE